MKLAGRIAVEPLDEERLANLERRLMDEIAGAAEAVSRGAPRRRPIGRWLAVACVAAAGVAGWLVRDADVVVGPPGGAARAPIAEAAAVRVSTDRERSVVDIGDARIASDPATALTVTRPAGGVLVELAHGQVELEVARRGERPPLVVRAGDTDVIVVGTRFTVGYDGAMVSVRVADGVVRVVRGRDDSRVAAGQAWDSSAGLVASRDGAGRVDVDDATAPGAAASSAAGSAAAAVTPRGRGPDAFRDHRAAVPDASAPPARPARAAAPSRSPAGSDVPRRPVQVAHGGRDEQALDLRAAIRAQPVEPALDLAEPSGTAAIAKYYEIAAHTSGAAASQAFYSIAVVRHEKLGRNDEALDTLDAYVRRFPGGKEYRAALWLRVRILCLDKLDDRCRAAAYTYLHEAPDGAAARVAERVTLAD